MLAWFEDAVTWPDALLPAYQGGSIGNLAASIIAGMDAGRPAAEHLLPPVVDQLLPGDFFRDARVVILIVIDGLGSLAVAEASRRGDVPGLDSAPLQSELTSVFPATTAAATTSLQFGVAPGTHGMAGYTLYLPEIDDVFNMITWRRAGNGDLNGSEPRPEGFLPATNIFSLLDAAGIDTVIVSNAAFENSPLTRAQASCVRYRGYRTLAEFGYRLIREVERPGRRFVFGYWDGYDVLGHTWSTAAEVARLEIRMIDQALREAVLAPLATMSEDVALLLTADHGHIPTPHEERIDLTQSPGLMESLRRRPTGESRQLGLAFHTGRAAELDGLVAAMENRMVALDLANAVEAGLYGPNPHHSDLIVRSGELLLLARGHNTFAYPGGTSGSRGGHGSLTPEEMRVPLLGWRFPDR